MLNSWNAPKIQYTRYQFVFARCQGMSKIWLLGETARWCKIGPKSVVGGIFGRFFLTSINADWNQLVTSYLVRLRLIWWFYVNQWPNYSTLWSAGPVLRTVVLCCRQYLIAFCRWPKAASDVIYGRFGRLVGPNTYGKCVKFDDPRLNRSREIPPEAIGERRYFRLFLFTITSDQK